MGGTRGLGGGGRRFSEGGADSVSSAGLAEARPSMRASPVAVRTSEVTAPQLSPERAARGSLGIKEKREVRGLRSEGPERVAWDSALSLRLSQPGRGESSSRVLCRGGAHQPGRG